MRLLVLLSTRQTFEKYQIIVYFTALGCGLAIGLLLPDQMGLK